MSRKYRKYYHETYPKVKEDINNTYYKCSWCSKKIKITSNGVDHWRDNHGIRYSLDELFEMRLQDIKWEKKIYFGDE